MSLDDGWLVTCYDICMMVGISVGSNVDDQEYDASSIKGDCHDDTLTVLCGALKTPLS